MSKAKTLEVVLAFHNGSAFIEAQLDSIIRSALLSNHTFKISIYDDASRPEESANLIRICQKWSQVEVHRINNNLGVIKTFELGISRANSDLIMLSDQDDVWLQDKVSTSIRMIEDMNSPALGFTNLTVVDRELRVIKTKMLDLERFSITSDRFALLFQNQIAGCTIIMNKKLKSMALPFPAGITMHDHWLALCAAFGGVLVADPKPSILYRQHGSNAVGSPKRRLLKMLMTPREASHQLKRSLESKSTQIVKLADRLRSSEPKIADRLEQVSRAFRLPSFQNLNLLLSLGVFKERPFKRTLTALAYLSNSRSSTRGSEQ